MCLRKMLMIFVMSLLGILLPLSASWANNENKIPSKWCIDNGSHYSSGSFSNIMPIPPMKEGNFNICPSKHLDEISIKKVKKYYSTDVGKNSLCNLIQK